MSAMNFNLIYNLYNISFQFGLSNIQFSTTI